MFNLISEKIQGIFKEFRGYGKIRENNIEDAVKEIKFTLLQADANYKVVNELISNIKTESLGDKVLKSIKPADQFIKIVNDRLIDIFTSDKKTVIRPGDTIMLMGPNGAGKTTTSVKLALLNKTIDPFLISTDFKRPAALEQLIQLSEKNNVKCFREYDLKKDNITNLKKGLALTNNKQLKIIDTAGNLDNEDEYRENIKKIINTAKPDHMFFIIDAMGGQGILKLVQRLKEIFPIGSIILTKLDSDTRGGLALSIVKVTGLGISYVSNGEKPCDFEEFNSERIVSRILGMGDIVGLVKKAEEAFSEEESMKMLKKAKKGDFNFNDMLKSLDNMSKIGNISSLLDSLPGNMTMNISPDAINEKDMIHNRAIIQSMTLEERLNQVHLNNKRRLRIASGCGLPVNEVNRFVNNFEKMKKMMKKFGNTGFLPSM